MIREHANKGRPPRDKTIPLHIRWRNGKVSRHTYTAAQLDWRLRGDDHDVAFFWRVNGQDDLEEAR